MTRTPTGPVPFVDLIKPHVVLKQELLEVVAQALDSASFIGGPMVAGFEADFAGYVGTRFAAGVGSGTDALRFALMAMGIGPGQGVVTVPNTFIATTEAISQAGAKIYFVDCEADTCLLDVNRLEDFLRERFERGPQGERPAAILPVHLYGQTADMDAILSLARKYELKVLEDAAQAHGATYKGRPAGCLGDAASFSFYPGKNLGACGEAGAVTTNDPQIDERVRMLRDHGQRTKYYHLLEGYNGRLDAIQAGFLRVKLRHLDEWNQKRRQLAQIYDRAFAGAEGIRPVRILSHNLSCHHLYVIQVAPRDALKAHLEAKGIATGLHYPVPLHLQECYHRLGYSRGTFPCAERSASEIISLPIYPDLEAEQVSRVAQEVLSFFH